MSLQAQIEFIITMRDLAGNDYARAKFQAVLDSLKKLQNASAN